MVDYENCTMCPRACHANRHKTTGFCKEKSTAFISWTGLHKGEEDIVSGKNGSGMIFFRGCSLGCPTCQNYQINTEQKTKIKSLQASKEILINIIDDMLNMGAYTISFVTPEHFVPLVVDVCSHYRDAQADVKFVFNTSGWISTDSVDALMDYIDIWLWDTKTHSEETALLFLGNKNYPEEEKKSFEHLISLLVNKNKKRKLLKKDDVIIIVRHLMLPGQIDSTIKVIKDFAAFKDLCFFSLMNQFVYPLSRGNDMLELESKYGSRVSRKDFLRAVRALETQGITSGFIQESDKNEEKWLPDFNMDCPFPLDFAQTSRLFEKLVSQ